MVSHVSADFHMSPEWELVYLHDRERFSVAPSPHSHAFWLECSSLKVSKHHEHLSRYCLPWFWYYHSQKMLALKLRKSALGLSASHDILLTGSSPKNPHLSSLNNIDCTRIVDGGIPRSLITSLLSIFYTRLQRHVLLPFR